VDVWKVGELRENLMIFSKMFYFLFWISDVVYLDMSDATKDSDRGSLASNGGDRRNITSMVMMRKFEELLHKHSWLRSYSMRQQQQQPFSILLYHHQVLGSSSHSSRALIINGFQSHFFGGDGNGTQKS
jgi:hypothetical protein